MDETDFKDNSVDQELSANWARHVWKSEDVPDRADHTHEMDIVLNEEVLAREKEENHHELENAEEGANFALDD